jgi:hypothetical protein
MFPIMSWITLLQTLFDVAMYFIMYRLEANPKILSQGLKFILYEE